MLKFLRRQLLFNLSSIKQQIIVHNPAPIDLYVNEFPEQYLDYRVSILLWPDYLTKCQKSFEEMKNQITYKGVIIDDLNRLFVCIPTADPQLKKFVNVYYVLNTASPHSTLTQRALCAIHQTPYSKDARFPMKSYMIGGVLVPIYLSNPNPQEPRLSHALSNLNVLGMNFLTKFAGSFDINHGIKKKIRIDFH